MSEAMLDCAVVGGGPAGLSAAVNLHQRGKSVRVLGAGAGLLAKAERVDNYLGLPGLSGSEMLAAFSAHAQSLGIVPEPGRVANVLPMGDRFLLNFDGNILEARAVILAGGVAKAKPIEGESEFLGRGVSYCDHLRRHALPGPGGSGVGPFPRGGGRGELPRLHRL